MDYKWLQLEMRSVNGQPLNMSVVGRQYFFL